MDYASSYLKKQKDYLGKWGQFFQLDLRQGFQPLEFNTEVPSPVKDLTDFTDEEKKHFYFRFAQFNCEALIVFEQCFMYASRILMRLLPEDLEKQALMHFCKEEFVHTQAFRAYLRSEKVFNFPEKSLVIHRHHLLKNIFAWILKREPLAIIIPGAKSETYSLFYSKLFERHFGRKGNTFTFLNVIHSEDEVQHVQFDYQFIDSMVSRLSLFKQYRFVFYTLLMILFIQFIVILGFYQTLTQVKPKSSVLYRLIRMRFIFKWILWNFQPYIKTRQNLRAMYKQRPHFMYRIFRWVS